MSCGVRAAILSTKEAINSLSGRTHLALSSQLSSRLRGVLVSIAAARSSALSSQ
jgi:hypothetical protein